MPPIPPFRGSRNNHWWYKFLGYFCQSVWISAIGMGLIRTCRRSHLGGWIFSIAWTYQLLPPSTEWCYIWASKWLYWLFPKIMVFPPKSSILFIGFSHGNFQPSILGVLSFPTIFGFNTHPLDSSDPSPNGSRFHIFQLSRVRLYWLHGVLDLEIWIATLRDHLT